MTAGWSHTEERQRQQFSPAAYLKLMAASGRQCDHLQTDGTHKRRFITPLRVCVCVCGGGKRRGWSMGTCMVVYRPYQVQGSFFHFLRD